MSIDTATEAVICPSCGSAETVRVSVFPEERDRMESDGDFLSAKAVISFDRQCNCGHQYSEFVEPSQ